MCLFAAAYKTAKVKGTKCHAKTMMSRTADKTVEEKPSMCHLGRARREKDEGEGKKWRMTPRTYETR